MLNALDSVVGPGIVKVLRSEDPNVNVGDFMTGLVRAYSPCHLFL